MFVALSVSGLLRMKVAEPKGYKESFACVRFAGAELAGGSKFQWTL